MPENNQDQEPKISYQFASRLGMEFISGLLVGVLFGYIFDHYFKTKPWGIIVFLLLGAGTGFYNIFRLVQTEGIRVKLDKIKKDRAPND